MIPSFPILWWFQISPASLQLPGELHLYTCYIFLKHIICLRNVYILYTCIHITYVCYMCTYSSCYILHMLYILRMLHIPQTYYMFEECVHIRHLYTCYIFLKLNIYNINSSSSHPCLLSSSIFYFSQYYYCWYLPFVEWETIIIFYLESCTKFYNFCHLNISLIQPILFNRASNLTCARVLLLSANRYSCL